MATTSLVVHAAPLEMGRPPGFQELYQQYSETVYRTALRVTGNPADAEDVLQTVFLRILNQRPDFEAAWSSKEYFRRAATNASIDIIRRRMVHAETPLEGASQHAASDSSPLLKQRLREAIARLDPEDAEIFLLKYVEGLSVNELAEHFSIETGTVGSRLFRIREALKKVIEA
jgi:RNA polymerase sigma-70 factor, ECF subfamily